MKKYIFFQKERKENKFFSSLLKGINYLILAPCLKICKNMSHLTTEQRYVIATLYKRGVKKKEIAKEINVDPSTVGRELNRAC